MDTASIPRYFKPSRTRGRPRKKDRELGILLLLFPEKEYAAKRKAARKRSETNFTPKEWRSLVLEFGNKCLACGGTNLPLSSDHIVPLSRGGSDGIENIQPLCSRCNSKKGVRTIDYRAGFPIETI